VEVERFKAVACPESTKRWLLRHGDINAHCRIVDMDGHFAWQAWIDDGDGNMGDMESGKADGAKVAKHLAQLSARRLLSETIYQHSLSEALASSERDRKGTGVVAKGTKRKGSLRRGGV
jgi:hypothetical protein